MIAYLQAADEFKVKHKKGRCLHMTSRSRGRMEVAKTNRINI